VKELLEPFIRQARWFGGKGRGFEVTETRRLRLGELDGAAGQVTVELVTLTYDDGSTELYQVPVSLYHDPHPELRRALVGEWEDAVGHVVGYDALQDPAARSLWLRRFAEAEVREPDDGTDGEARGGDGGAVTFFRVADVGLDPTTRSKLLSGEQSNSSVAYGDEALMKLFRKVAPGRNPDIEIGAALTGAGVRDVAALHGWVEAKVDGELLQLGILQQFLREAEDGWELALSNLRHAGDFTEDARRLGEAVATVHVALAGAFGTETWDRDRLDRLAGAMSERLHRALGVVPQLEPHAAGLHAVFDTVRSLERPVRVQRVHGDLHLGQTLRTADGWKVIDFEGEPAKPLAERRAPDSAWRDVAGMLRSFEYAAEMTRREGGDPQRSRDWADRTVEAFLTGYRGASSEELDEPLLAAYTADKAVYEAVYEARNRPDWISIPLSALARLAGEDQTVSATPRS
jgi:maltokinase